MSDDRERTPETDAFALLGHEIRLDVLRAFFERYEPIDPDSRDEVRADRTLSYAELMSATGVEDSGKFNYHLEKLRGAYVEKVDGGYVPTASAIGLYEAVLANRPTESIAVDVEIDERCPYCETDLGWRYEQEYLTVECPACDEFWGLTYRFPKNGVAVRAGTDCFGALYDRMMYHVGLAATGQCPSCAGVVRSTIPRERLDGESTPTVELTCETCSWLATVDVVSALQFDPLVTNALLEIGVPIERSTGMRETEDVLPTVIGRPDSDDSSRVTIVVSCHDSTAEIVVDDEFDVHDVSVSERARQA
ncbi:helix-turn-helix domain-containing protein [Halovivax cerinus]|uniref:Helix-turn-helix domain-containing protein n=1 Tax=Halovivax cerinus TaxID=1487865 RepID=A0ABD5NMT6_9EURY|nr:helix-turn-helix domain-containing protein [Halovivax cerinus]